MKDRMYEVRRGPEDAPVSTRYYIMAKTGEQAIQERADEYYHQPERHFLNVEGVRWRTARRRDGGCPLLIKQFAAELIATEVIQHPKTGRWVPVDWREKRIAEIESQVEDLMAEMKELQ